jgi:hypothetical protein
MKLLENDLPPYLAKLDRHMPLSQHIEAESFSNLSLNNSIDTQKENLFESRHNIFDGDKYDIFSNQIDPALVHIGKLNRFESEKQDRLEFLRQQKQDIISSVEDDEYDDTYDSSNETNGQKNDMSLDKNQVFLIEVYNQYPHRFHPSARKTKERMIMKENLGWSDEQIEGWFTMLNRNVTIF